MASTSKFSMSAVLSLVDNMTNPYKKTTSKITALNRSLGGSFGTLNKSIDKVAMGVGRGLKNAAILGVGALSAGVVKATKDFIDLDSAITNAGAKFKDLDSGSKTFTKDLKALQTEARKVAKVTEFMATDTAGALDKMAMAGMTSVQSMELLAGTTNLATAANTDLTTAVDISTDTLGAFNLEASKLNLDKVSDQMAKVTTTANTDLLTMFESVKSGAPAFTAAGQKISTFNSLVGKLANAGIKGGESGTSLRNMILRLSKPTGEAADVINDLGIKIQDSQGNFRDIIDIIGDFEKGLKGMGSAQKTAALTTVFGARSVTGFNILLNEGQTELRKYQESIENSTGASKKMADAIRNSLGNRIKVLFSGLSELGLKFIEAFETRGRGALDKLITVVQNFDMNKVIDAVNNTIDGFRRLGGFIVEHRGLIEGLAIALVSFKLAILAVNAAQLIQMGLMAAAPVLAMIKVFMSLAKTEGILATAQLALNMAMSANPIGLIILGVAALIAIGILLVKNWDSVSAFFGKVWDVMVSGFQKILPVLEFVGRAFMSYLLTPINLVIMGIKGLLTLISKIPGVGDKIKPALDALSNFQSGINTVTLKGGREKNERERQESIEADQDQKTMITDIKNEARERRQESTQRNDIYLHAPSGSGISDTPGGAPSTAVSVGKQ